MAKFCDLNVPLPANGDCYHCFVFLPDRNVFVVVYNKSLYQLHVCLSLMEPVDMSFKSKIIFWIA